MSLGAESNLQKAGSADMDSLATLQRIAEALGEVDKDDLSEAGLLLVKLTSPQSAAALQMPVSGRDLRASGAVSITCFCGQSNAGDQMSADVQLRLTCVNLQDDELQQAVANSTAGYADLTAMVRRTTSNRRSFGDSPGCAARSTCKCIQTKNNVFVQPQKAGRHLSSFCHSRLKIV